MRPSILGRGRDSERGQSTVEWVGALLVVTVLVALVVAGGFPTQLEHGIECTVKKIIGQGGGCTAVATAPNVMPCPTSATTRTASDEFQVLFLDAGHKNTLIETIYSDGRVDYTLVDDGTLEAQEKFQAELKVGGFGFNAEASAAAGGELTGSYTFSFPNASAAAAFAKAVQSGGGWGVIAHDIAGGIPIAAPVASGLLNLVGIHGAPNGGSLADQYHQYLTSGFVAAGAVGQLKGLASGDLGPASVELGAELSAAAGFREVYAGDPSEPDGPQKGDVQIYVKLDGSADGSLMQALFGPKAAAAAKGNADAVITLDSSGHPKELEISARGNAGASGGLGVKQEGEPGSGASEGSGGSSEAGGLLKSLDLSSTLGAGQGYQYTATLDLKDDPQAVHDLTSLLNPDSAGPAMTGLIDQINTEGKQRLQPYQQSTSQTGGGAALEVSDVGAGANVSVGTQSQHLFAGWVQNPGGSWEPVICEK